MIPFNLTTDLSFSSLEREGLQLSGFLFWGGATLKGIRSPTDKEVIIELGLKPLPISLLKHCAIVLIGAV